MEIVETMVFYKLGLPLSMKNFNLYHFVSTLGLDAFLSNTTIEHRKHIVTSDLDIIKSDVLTKIREIKFREIKPINFDKAKSSILTSLEE